MSAGAGPLEDYAVRFDEVFASLAQRRGFREYLSGLLAPRERNKTLTWLAGAEPVVGAQHAAVQRLQFFLSESRWDHERVDDRRLELLCSDPATAPHEGGVLVVDDSGDRKDGTKTAHVGSQWLGRHGKTDRGIVTVTTLWADENLYYPLHAVPYTPAHHFPKGKTDPGFRTKLTMGAALACQARTAGIAFRAVVADCAYGDHDGFRGECRGAAVRDGAQATTGHQGLPGRSTHPCRCRPRPTVGWATATRGVAQGRPPVPGRAHPDLVGRGRGVGLVGSGRDDPAGGGDHRPGHPAGAFHLVSGHRPTPPRWAPGE
ncbi:IS701 family transposase [Longimycelium tulufanense]|uniref:IS701 family transposase n=1 Tax=Longimycelium tulufanense TaxID=907463 RepID=UPI001E57A50F|nr:transposase [Longimycelium tulufanense]